MKQKNISCKRDAFLSAVGSLAKQYEVDGYILGVIADGNIGMAATGQPIESLGLCEIVKTSIIATVQPDISPAKRMASDPSRS